MSKERSGLLSNFVFLFSRMLFCFTPNGNLNSAKSEVIIMNSNTSSLWENFLCNTVDGLQCFGFFFPLLESSDSFCEVGAVPTFIPPLRNTYLLIFINGTQDKLLKT